MGIKQLYNDILRKLPSEYGDVSVMSQLIYIFLKFQCVFCALNFSLANTNISEESYFRMKVC